MRSAGLGGGVFRRVLCVGGGLVSGFLSRSGRCPRALDRDDLAVADDQDGVREFDLGRDVDGGPNEGEGSGISPADTVGGGQERVGRDLAERWYDCRRTAEDDHCRRPLCRSHRRNRADAGICHAKLLHPSGGWVEGFGEISLALPPGRHCVSFL